MKLRVRLVLTLVGGMVGCEVVAAPPAATGAAPDEGRVRAAALGETAAPPPAPVGARPPVRDAEPAGGVPSFRDADIPWETTPVLRELGRIAAEVVDTRYLHSTQVVPTEGVYHFDCSGMAAWVLARSAPRAHAQTTYRQSTRPLEATYARVIGAAASTATSGWRRVPKVAEARPGDVLAWTRPKNLKTANTGHVAFIVLPPRRLPWSETAYLVRLVDATSLPHLDDARAPGDGSGFGYGTILLLCDTSDTPIAYGWVGPSGPVFETTIVLGRPLS